jgi:hypothetical protein
VTPTAKRPRLFADLTQAEAFNIGRVVGLLGENVRAQKLPGGIVSITTKFGRLIPLDELLDRAKQLSNTL